MSLQDDPNRCSIVVTGDELAELKRHAHQIPECPGLDRRIQKYNGNKPLVITLDELDWLVAVLDAVLHDPKGYPCVQYDPWKLEYVPRTDARCVTCGRLYDRLNSESERLNGIITKRCIQWKKREEARERRKAEREASDQALSGIRAVFEKRRCPVLVVRASRGYSIYHESTPVSRIRPRGKYWEVLWWSYRGKWEPIGDLGGVICETVEEAATYVLDDPMGVFWR